MDHLRKKNNMSKSKKKTGDMEIEEEIMDYEHINKDQDFQTVTFDFLEPNHKYQNNLYMIMKKSFSFVTWDIYSLFDAICEQNELLGSLKQASFTVWASTERMVSFR